MMDVSISQHPSGKYVAHVFFNGKDYYGEANSPGMALVELGSYLESMPKTDPLVEIWKEALK